ncbi:MAG: siroheme synthase, partial [Phenylobacterium sp.]
DILICDEGVHADVLALTRRDAERLAAQSPERLTQMAADGLRIARLVVDPGWRSEHAALTAAGVDVEILPIAS